jgi:hypothetical protein
VTNERRKAANQANARRSTGPKTPEGKAVIRLNAARSIFQFTPTTSGPRCAS